MSTEAWVGVAVAVGMPTVGGLLAWMFKVTQLLGSLPSISRQLTRVCKGLDDNTDQHAVIWEHLDDQAKRLGNVEKAAIDHEGRIERSEERLDAIEG